MHKALYLFPILLLFCCAAVAQSSPPDPGCKTPTYFMRVKDAQNRKIEIKELQTLPDGSFIVLGNVFVTASQKQAVIFKYSNSGSLIGQQLLSLNNLPATAADMKITLHGKILITGTINSNTPFLVQLNEDLIQEWGKTLGSVVQANKITLQLFDDKIALAVQHSTSVSCYMLQNTGDIIWGNSVDIPDLVSLAGFGQFNWAPAGLVVNCFRGGKQLVEVFEIEAAAGALVASHLVGDGNIENSCFETTCFNGRANLLGVIKERPGDIRFVRYNVFGSAVFETKHTFRVSAPVDFNISGAMDNAGDAMGFCLPQTGTLIFIRQFSAYQTFPEHTKSYTVPVGSSLQAITRSKDGGFLFGLNTAANDELILIKTDSTGILAGCGYAAITNDFAEVLNNQNTPVNRVYNNITGGVTAATATLMAANLAGQFDCNQIYCPPTPVTDTCLDTYFKSYRSGSYIESIGGYKIMRNDKRLVTSIVYDRILGGMNQLTRSINMLDEKGAFLNGVTVLKDSVSPSFDVYPMSDSSFMLIQYFSEGGHGYYNYSLVTDNYQIVWSKTLNSDGSLSSSAFTFGGYYADKEGNFYIVGTTLGFMERPKINVYKIGPNGEDLWGRTYEMAGGNFSTVSITSTNTALVIVVNANNPGTVSVQIDKNTGTMLSSYVWQTAFNGSQTSKYLYFENDRILYFSNTADNNLLLCLLDTTGKPLKMKKIITPPTVFRSGCFKQSKFYGQYNYFDGAQYKEALIKVDTALNIEYITEEAPLLSGGIGGIDVSDNGYIYSSGTFYYGTNSVHAESYIKKYNPSGVIGTCPFNFISPVIENIDASPAVLGHTTSVFQAAGGTYTFDFIPDTSGQTLAKVFCSSPSVCDSINISGPDTVCRLNNPISFRINKSPGCLLNPLVQNDTSRFSMLLLTDTSVLLSFKQTGSTWIKTFVNTGCKIIRDSLWVHVSANESVLTIGPDTSICPGDSVLLTAQGDFQTYQWQDGTISNVFLAKDSGLYVVKALGNCGEIYIDSLRLNWNTIPFLQFPRDTILQCQGDTTYITNPAGFVNYSWLPASIVAPGALGVSIFPSQNSSVSLTASTASGCTTSDSFFVLVNAKPVFSLGNDTAVCNYDSIQLAVPGTYSSYLWSTDNTGSIIQAAAAGMYWLTVTSAAGCAASDSVMISHHPEPQPELGNDFTLCTGESKRLYPGAFATYGWQDNSAASFFIVSDTGLFRVIVTDTNTCKSSDSIRVLAVYPLPADFLPQNDSICQFENMLISPNRNFNWYQWQDNSFMPSFTASGAGEYILSVRDENGCFGKDSIRLVEKNCVEALYIPAAFSPNADAINDVFRVKLYGILSKFRMEIFNRYGERVFSSTDPNKGWDGYHKGKPATAGGYVFQCLYKFPGKKEWLKKGSLVLVR